MIFNFTNCRQPSRPHCCGHTKSKTSKTSTKTSTSRNSNRKNMRPSWHHRTSYNLIASTKNTIPTPINPRINKTKTQRPTISSNRYCSSSPPNKITIPGLRLASKYNPIFILNTSIIITQRISTRLLTSLSIWYYRPKVETSRYPSPRITI